MMQRGHRSRCSPPIGARNLPPIGACNPPIGARNLGYRWGNRDVVLIIWLIWKQRCSSDHHLTDEELVKNTIFASQAGKIPTLPVYHKDTHKNTGCITNSIKLMQWLLRYCPEFHSNFSAVCSLALCTHSIHYLESGKDWNSQPLIAPYMTKVYFVKGTHIIFKFF